MGQWATLSSIWFNFNKSFFIVKFSIKILEIYTTSFGSSLYSSLYPSLFSYYLKLLAQMYLSSLALETVGNEVFCQKQNVL